MRRQMVTTMYNIIIIITGISVLDFEEIGNPEKNVREQVHLSI